MSSVSPRSKNHWSVRLKIRRPGSAGSLVLVILALLQAVLLFATASTNALNGSLYGCAVPCGIGGALAIPWLATLFSLAIFALPGIIGALSQSWQEAVSYAAAPWWLAVIFTAQTLLAPKPTALRPVPTQFTGPFWTTSTSGSTVEALCFSLILFAGLGFVGFVLK